MSSDAVFSAYEMATVLFMDIVRYSLQTIDRQTHVLTLLQQLVRESAEFQRASAAGELTLLPTGDGMVLVFTGDPLSPVKCALDIARSLSGYPDVPLRMGIHMGPVRRHSDIRQEENFVGGGINIAQRVMDFGDAGHILLSNGIAEILDQLADWRGSLRDLGNHEVKHGVQVHLFNLCRDGLGNPEAPQKMAKGATATSPSSQERLLDVAMAKEIPVFEPAELVALVRRLESDGLKGVLELDSDSTLSSFDVRSKPLRIDFPVDSKGKPGPVELTLKIESPDFEPRSQSKVIRIPPDGDSDPCTFLLVPKQMGELRIVVELYTQELSVLSRTLRTSVKDSARVSVAAPRTLLTIPLMVRVQAPESGEKFAVPTAGWIPATHDEMGTLLPGNAAQIAAYLPPSPPIGAMPEPIAKGPPGWRNLRVMTTAAAVLASFVLCVSLVTFQMRERSREVDLPETPVAAALPVKKALPYPTMKTIRVPVLPGRQATVVAEARQIPSGDSTGPKPPALTLPSARPVPGIANELGPSPFTLPAARSRRLEGDQMLARAADSTETTPDTRTPPSDRISPPPQAQSVAAPEDRFGRLRSDADLLKTAYDKLDTDNMAEVDRLLLDRSCQINRIGNLLDRTNKAMHQWSDAEAQYWRRWAEVEQQRVDGQQKDLAAVKADMQHAEDLVLTARYDREELLRNRATLEKFGARTAAIQKQMDSLAQGIEESEARLAEAQKAYDDATIKAGKMQASISARLIDIHQNQSRVEGYSRQLASYYQQKRAAAQEICTAAPPNKSPRQ